jgi:hypothetical protein
MVSILFARQDSVYKKMGVDVWDIERDARKWPGGTPCVAHPPCRAWGQLAHLAKPRPDEKELAIWSIHRIRENGGVLEHPRASKLWQEMNLPAPGTIDEYGGFSVCVDQFWWGHKAKKNSLLYICGCLPEELPAYPLRFDAVEFVVCSPIKKKSGRRVKQEITKREREATPEPFAKWLIEVAEKCITLKK